MADGEKLGDLAGNEPASGDPVVLFDGECAFCHGAVNFIRRRDRTGRLRFVPLRSPATRPYLRGSAGANPPVSSEEALRPAKDGAQARDGDTRSDDDHGDESDAAQLDGVGPIDALDTVYLYEDGKLYDRSTAALRISRYFGGLWPLLYALVIVPRPLRDGVYRLVARHRHRLPPL